MDTLDAWVKSEVEGNSTDMLAVKVRVGLFLDNLISDSLFHTAIQGEAHVSDGMVSGYVTVKYRSNLDLNKHKYSLMVVKGIQKLLKDIAYYAPTFQGNDIAEELCGVKIELSISKEVNGASEAMTFEQGKIFYIKDNIPGRHLTKAEATSILDSQHTKKIPIHVYILYTKNQGGKHV